MKVEIGIVGEPLAGVTARMARHAQTNASHVDLLDAEFLDWYAIPGSADLVRERLLHLVGLGLRHLYLIGGTMIPEPPPARLDSLVDLHERFAADVLPTLRNG